MNIFNLNLVGTRPGHSEKWGKRTSLLRYKMVDIIIIVLGLIGIITGLAYSIRLYILTRRHSM